MKMNKEKSIKNKSVILFADDNDIVLDVGEKLLQKLGYQPLLAKTGHETIEVFKKNRNEVDLVILDIRMPDLSALEITAITYLIIGPLSGLYLIFSDFSTVSETENYLLNLGYITILAFLGSVVAIIGFNYLIKHTTAIFAASVTYIIPVFAILWGIFDKESISIFQIISIGVILLGVYLVNRNN